MPWWGIMLIVIGAVLVAAVVALFIFGKRMQKKQAEAEKQMAEVKQTVTILVIDKQKKKMKESGLPESVIAQAPKYTRNLKMPVVKAKVGPRVMTLIADNEVYDLLPVKKTVTVSVSGIYITEIKSVRGASVPKKPEKKKNFLQKLRDKALAATQRNK